MASPLLFIAGGRTPSTNDGPVRTFVEFDSTVEMTTNFRGDVSTHPVESGTRVSDHFTRENPVFQIRGVTTNTPIYEFNEFSSVQNTGKRTKNMYDVLVTMYSTGSLFTLVSDLDSYDNCVIKSIGYTQTVDKVEGLYVDLEVEQIRVVGTQRVVSALPVSAAKAGDSQPTTDGGTQSGQSADDGEVFSRTRRVFTGG
tara:strand:- start:16276 stop:16869 length:594 start_codon:yes stop_codon:yes gene_type:complete